MLRAWTLAALVVAAQAVATNQGAQLQARPRESESDLLRAARSLRLTAKVQKAVVPVGKPVVLSITLKNQVPKVVDFTDDVDIDVNFLLLAKRKDGRKVSLTRYGTYVSQGGYTNVAGKPRERFSSVQFVTLKRGERKQYTFSASKIYDMTRKGIYVLTVVRPFTVAELVGLPPKNERSLELRTQNGVVFGSGKAVRLVSNTVTVTVQ